MSADEFDEALDREKKSAAAGLSPMFGEWHRVFPFPPVPYSAPQERRAVFRDAIQAELGQHWLYSGSIQVEITLRVDVQTTLETDETADLDNYAKLILDTLKGERGVFIDDSQVQALAISWLDGYERQSFSVSIRGGPDDFVLKPLGLYEMPDGLWYPFDRRGGANAIEGRQEELDLYAGLSIVEMISGVKKSARAAMRKAGANRLRAYQRSKYVVADLRGFHRSRVEGFTVHSRKAWQTSRRKWREDNPDQFRELEAILEDAKANYGRIIDVLAGR